MRGFKLMSPALHGKPKPKNKYGAVRTNGYASKREAAYAAHLGFMKLGGKIVGWLEQVPIKLPGGIKYVCDFMVIHPDGSVRFVEVKGMETPAWKLKLKLLEEGRPEVFSRLDVVR